MLVEGSLIAEKHCKFRDVEAGPISIMSKFAFFCFLAIYSMLSCTNLLEKHSVWSWASEAGRFLLFVTANELHCPSGFKYYIRKSYECFWYSGKSLPAETFFHLDLLLPLNDYTPTPAASKKYCQDLCFCLSIVYQYIWISFTGSSLLHMWRSTHSSNSVWAVRAVMSLAYLWNLPQ